MNKRVLVMSLAIIFLFALVLTIHRASAADYSSALVDVWNSRKDLQKAFPGDPSNNSKLEAWCKKYGWKEDASLSSCSSNKAVSNITISPNYEERIAALEAKITELTTQVSQLSTSLSSASLYNPVVSSPIVQEGGWRDCVLSGKYDSYLESLDNNTSGYSFAKYQLVCPVNINDATVNGSSKVRVWFK